MDREFFISAVSSYQDMVYRIALHCFGQPQDVANCVMAAVSGRLDFATGQVLNADGGFHIRRL